MPQKRPTNSRYPLWVGLIALGGLSLLWRQTSSSEATVAAPAEDASAPLTPDAEVAARRSLEPLTEPHLTWRVIGRSLPQAQELNSCFEQKGDEIRATEADGALFLDESRLIRKSNGLWLETPIGKSPHRALVAQVQVAECLQTKTAVLVDEDVNRRFEAGHWPHRTAAQGLPVGALVEVKNEGKQFVTHGLARLGLPEIEMDQDALSEEGEEDEAALFWQAVAMAIFTGEMPLLVNGTKGHAKIEPKQEAPWHFEPVRSEPQVAARNPNTKKKTPVRKPRTPAQTGQKQRFFPDYR